MCMCTIRGMSAYNTIRNIWAHTISYYGKVTEKNGHADPL